MKTKLNAPLLVTLAVTAVMVVVAVSAPTIALAALASAVTVGAFLAVRGWWRRAFVLTIVAMFAGASHIEALSAVGSYAKIASIGLLAISTLITMSRSEDAYRNGLHRSGLVCLWATVALAALSVIWSQSRPDTMLQAITFAAFVFVLHRTSTVRWQNRQMMVGDIGTAYWASTTLLAVGTALAFTGFPEAISSFSGRHQGLLNNPNLLGMVAAVTLTIGIGWAAHQRSPLAWASLLIPASQVVLSESRTAMVAAGAAIVWAVVRGSLLRVAAAALALVVVSIVTAALQINLFGDNLERFSSNEEGGVLNSRNLAWMDVFQYVQQNPLGVGWAATTETLTSMNASGLTAGLSSVHNSYLQLLFELGWIGIVPALALVTILLAVAFRAKADRLGTGLVATAVAGTLIQLAESSMFGVGQPYPYLFWFAVLAAIVNTEPQPEREAKRDRKTANFYSRELGTSKMGAVR